jgi:hypothetical protein
MRTPAPWLSRGKLRGVSAAPSHRFKPQGTVRKARQIETPKPDAAPIVRIGRVNAGATSRQTPSCAANEQQLVRVAEEKRAMGHKGTGDAHRWRRLIWNSER